MSDAPVSLYEAGPTDVRLLGRHPSLATAADELPPGAYTTLRTYGGRGVVRLDQHLRRLEDSVALQGRPARIDAEAARRSLAAVLDATGHAQSRVRLTFSPPRLFLAVEPFSPPPARLYEEGVACVTLDVHRENPHAKDTRFIATAQGAYRRLPTGVEEGLILGDSREILEGLSSNFFAVCRGILHTEEERALLGVTRSLVLEVAERVLPVEKRAVRLDELGHVEEAFLTSVSREILPVVRIDDAPVGDGCVGPATRAIMTAFSLLVERETVVLR